MKFSVLLAFLVFAAVAAAEEFKCQEGVPYKENNCNACYCSRNGQMSCSLMACFDSQRAELNHCKVGTTYDKDCNKCWCTKNWGIICTDHKC